MGTRTCRAALVAASLLCVHCSQGGEADASGAAPRKVRAAAVAAETSPAVPTPGAPKPEVEAALPVPAIEGPAAPSIASPDGVELVTRDGVSLGMLVIARGVSLRQPVSPGATFSLAEGNKLYAVMEVQNPDKAASELSVAWVQDGSDKERGAVTLAVGEQPKWRTWAYHSGFKKPGRWTAVVRDAGGEILGRAPFEITE